MKAITNHSNNRRRFRLLATLAIAVATVLTATACGDPGSGTAEDVAALTSAVDELVVVCDDGDHARMADLTGKGIPDRDRDQDNVFNPDVENVSVLDRDISIDGDSATVTVTLEVAIDGDTGEVERVWDFEKVDDAWVLSSVPDCLFP